MGTVWPKNRERGEHRLDVAQHLTLICGIGGCRKRIQGRFEVVIEKRDAHRAEAHPDFTPPDPRRRRVAAAGAR